MALDFAPGDVVALIDGYFFGRPAVRQKEILHLLDRGVRVYGAASTGALRAAELHPFEMIGTGRVFDAYRRSDLVGDDEVAVLHTDAEAGFRPLTEALVTLRHNLDEAVSAGICAAGTARAIVEAAKEMPFFERTLGAIFSRARRHITAPREMPTLHAYLHKQGTDIKQQDAADLLIHIADLPDEPNRHTILHKLNETIHFKRWQSPEPAWLKLCRLYATDYSQFQEQTALADLARRSGSDVDLAGGNDPAILHAALNYVSAHSLLDTQAPPVAYASWLTPQEQELPDTAWQAKLAALTKIAGNTVSETAPECPSRFIRSASVAPVCAARVCPVCRG
ncbi:TfuA-like protein [Micromonospora chersina]|uniref:TfuA-like protein n=1 Tax=Micromonospora chersina TaxID=47854 RepID=UPI00372486E9